MGFSCSYRMVILSVGAFSATAALLYGAILCTREKGKKCTCANRVKGKIVAITGANSGIGFETALQLAKFGARVYVCCRKETAGEAAVNKIKNLSKNSHVYFIPLDLCDLKSCYKFVDELLQAELKLDILIHNAGVFHAVPKRSVDGFEITYQTNFLGPVAVTESALPLLLESPSPRIIFVNSEAHKIASREELIRVDFTQLPTLETFDQFVMHYGFSKLAVKLYASYLAHSYRNLQLIVASVNPGNVWTPVYRSCWSKWYEFPMKILCYFLMRSPAEGAQSIIHASNAERVTSGSYISDCNEALASLEDREVEVAQFFISKVYRILKLK